MIKPNKVFGLPGWALFASALSLAACAGPPVPTAELRSAGDAIARAQDDGADHLAPQELQLAQGKFARARSAVTSKHNDDAKRLAEQAEVDANYADSLANVQRIQASASQLGGAQQQLQQRLQQTR